MKEVFSKQSKETRCYIMSAVMVFEGFKGVDDMTEIRGEMLLDVLGLTKEEIERFPMPSYAQLIAHLKLISNPEVRDWVITNTYSPVLRSRRNDALHDFRTFCDDLGWNKKEIKDSLDLIEEIEGIKPIDNGAKLGSHNNSSSGTGCLSVIMIVIVSTIICSFVLI